MRNHFLRLVDTWIPMNHAVSEMKIDVENELAQYIKKGIEIDKENKEIIIY